MNETTNKETKEKQKQSLYLLSEQVKAGIEGVGEADLAVECGGDDAAGAVLGEEVLHVEDTLGVLAQRGLVLLHGVGDDGLHGGNVLLLAGHNDLVLHAQEERLQHKLGQQGLVARRRHNLGQAGAGLLEDRLNNLVAGLQDLQAALVEAVGIGAEEREETKNG